MAKSSSFLCLAACGLALAFSGTGRADIFNPAWSALGPAPILNGQTTPTMPVSGRVTTIVVHPTDAKTAYVGTAQGGVYRTTDGGTTWTQLMESASSLAIGALALAPSDPTTLFIGTGEPFNSSDSYAGVGLYVVTKADTTPVLAGPFNRDGSNADVFTGNAISRILVSSSDANTILVSTTNASSGIGSQPTLSVPSRGVYRCSNALNASPTFTSLSTDGRVFDMAADSGDLNNVVVATPGAIYRMTNAISGSVTFTAMFTPTYPFGLVRLALNKVGSTLTVIAATDETQVVNGKAVDGTGTVRRATYTNSAWSSFSAPLSAATGFAASQAFYDMAVALDPGNASKIYIGGCQTAAPSRIFASSTDSGATFTSSESGLHSDSHAIAVAPSDPAVIYFGSDGGIWKSINSGGAWTSLNNSTFSATQFQGIAVHPTDRNFTIIGAQDNGTENYSSSRTWALIEPGDAGYCLIDQNATSTSDMTFYSTRFNLQGSLIGFFQVVGVNNNFTYTFRGYSQTGTDPMGNPIYTSNNGISGADSVKFYAPMALGPGNPNSLYFGTDRLYRSTDKGVNMSVVSQAPLDPLPMSTTVGNPISSIAISPQNDGVRVVGLSNGKVFATTNGSSAMTNVSGSIPANYIGRVMIDPQDVKTVYVAIAQAGLPAGQNLWKTTNLSIAGTTWTAFGTGLPQIAINALLVDPNNSSRIYAGTDDGIWASDDAGASWSRYGTGMPHVAIFGLAMQNSNRVLRASTHGRGMYEILPDAPHTPPDVAITTPAHNSAIGSFTSIAGTALDHSGTGLAGNSINFTLYHVSTDQYWTGSGWSSTATQFGVTVDLNTHTWTYSGALPTGANLRTGQYLMSAFTRDNNGDNSQPQSGVNNISFNVDASPPAVTIVSPAEGSSITTSTYSFNGAATDDQGVNRVILFIRRESDQTFWNGSSWVADSQQANLLTTYNAGSHTWTPNANLPVPGSSLANGNYNFQALAFDNAGNFTYATAEVTANYHPQWTWTHGSIYDSDPNNNDNRWDNPANWSPYGVPPAEAIVNIGTDTVNSSFIPQQTFYGLNIGNGGGLNAAIVNIAVGSTMNWTGGSFTGTLNLPPGASANFSGSDKLLGQSSVVNNHGTITWAGSGVVQGYQSVTFNNFADGLLKITADGVVFTNYYSSNVFNNLGKIQKTGGAGTTLLQDWAYDNSGAIEVDNGTVNFPQGVKLTNNTVATGAGRLLLGSGNAVINGNIHLDGGVVLQFGGANVSGTSTFFSTNNGTLEWTGGSLGDNITIDQSAALSIDGGGTKLLGNGAVIQNYGIIEVSDSGQLQGYQSSIIDNHSGASFFLSSDAPLTNYYSGNALIIEPGATCFKTATAGGTTQIDWTFNNNGLVRVSQGTLALNSLGNSSGVFNVFASTALRFLPGANQTMGNGATFTGAGKLQVVGGTVNATGNVNAGSAANPFTCEISSGVLTTTDPGIFTAYGTTNWTGGVIGGQFHVAAGSTLNLTGTDIKQIGNGATISNAGTINWTGPGLLQGYQSSTINNLAGATFNVIGDGQVFGNYYYGNVFNNAGTFAKTSGSGNTILTDWTFNNTGTIDIASGVIEYDSTLNLNPGTILSGAGLVRFVGTINVADGVSLGNNIELAGGNFNSANPANPSVVTGTLTWTTGNLNGTWNIASGATFNIAGNATKLIGNGAAINNAGTINWSGPGDLQAYQSVVLTNLSGANFNATSDATMSNYYSGNAFTNNAGAHFTKNGGSGTTRIDWNVNNAGNMTVSTGRVEMSNGGSSAGAFITAANTTMAFVGGSPNLTNGSMLQGPGKFQLSGGNLTVSGSVIAGTAQNHTTFELMPGANLYSGPAGSYLAVYGLFNWTGGSLSQVIIPAGTAMNVSGPDTKQINNDGSISNNGTITWLGDGQILGYQNSTILNNASAQFVVQTDGTPLVRYYYGNLFINQGTFIKNGGTGTTSIADWRFDNNGGTINIRSGTVAFTSELHLNDGSTLSGPTVGAPTYLTSNGGTHLNGTTLLKNSVLALIGSSINAETNASLSASGLGQFQWLGGSIAGTLGLNANCPAFVSGPDSKLLDNGAVLNNAGALTFRSGSTLQGFQGSIINNLAGANLTFETGASLTRIYYGNAINNAGTITMAGSVGPATISGWAFSQSSTGVLNLRIASLSGFDSLQLDFAATFEGTLNVSLLNGYLPNVGDGFPLLAYSAGSGQFATVHAPGFVFNVNYNQNNFSLVAAMQPSVLDWKIGYFGDPNSAAAADTATPANDGIANLLKYALGLNPTLPFGSLNGLTGVGQGSSASRGLTDATQSNNHHATFSFRRIDPVNVTYVVQASDNLADPSAWGEVARLNAGTNAWFGNASVGETGTGSTRSVTVTDSFALSQKPKRFFRLVVSH